MLAAEKRRKEPRTVHRPSWITGLQSGRNPATGRRELTDPSTVTSETQGEIRGHLAVAAKFAASGRVRTAP